MKVHILDDNGTILQVVEGLNDDSMLNDSSKFVKDVNDAIAARLAVLHQKHLLRYGTDGRQLDKEGRMVKDSQGRPVDIFGKAINVQGKMVDSSGKSLGSYPKVETKLVEKKVVVNPTDENTDRSKSDKYKFDK